MWEGASDKSDFSSCFTRNVVGVGGPTERLLQFHFRDHSALQCVAVVALVCSFPTECDMLILTRIELHVPTSLPVL